MADRLNVLERADQFVFLFYFNRIHILLKIEQEDCLNKAFLLWWL